MKTDHPIYLFLTAGAEAFRILTGGRRLVGDYRFRSITIKGIERRLDGIFEPCGHDGPVYVLEFQGQAVDHAWYNLLTKIGLYGEVHPARDVLGIAVFLHERQIPRFPTWLNGDDAPLTGVALNQFLPQWLACEPDNPYLAVFAPLVIDSDTELQRCAPALWRTVRDAPLPPAVQEVLSQVLEFWFFERFKTLTAREIWAMLNLLTPIEETRAYQSIKAEGKVEDLTRLLARRFGPLPQWASVRIAMADVTQLNTWLDGLFDATNLESLIGPERDDDRH